ncbi:DNA polymerase [Pandoraea terrae]|uniref:DNA polymerase n=1 Tax=Pandoraea terrae TaxID=1537710 RepID=A0A5E4XE16_9BURK|nr:DNA polymerase [Pandoraea terrae]
MHLPQLALEIAPPRTPERSAAAVAGVAELPDADDPIVVLSQTRVWQAGAMARRAGVRASMRRGGVLALLPQARFHDRDEVAEAKALEALALALLRFGPDVAIAAPQCVMLEAGASLRLFGGLAALCRLVVETAHTLGHRVTLGVAATAAGATLLARDMAGGRGRRRRSAQATQAGGVAAAPVPEAAAPIDLDALVPQLDALPVALLTSAGPWLDWLAQIGCATLGALRALPRAGIRRRCGAELPGELARAYGEEVEAPAWYRAPPHFEACLPLPALTSDVNVLLFGLRRLLAQLAGWLGARQLGARIVTLVLEHEPLGRHTLAPTQLAIALAAPSASPDHLLAVCKERLARQPLAAPVLTLRLDVTQTAPYAPVSGALLPEPGRVRHDLVHLLERLSARLGEDRVTQLHVRGDHRPETAFVCMPHGAALPAGAARAGPAADTVSCAAPPRPAWLLDAPRRLEMRQEKPWRDGPLTLLSGPERIEAGWWEPGTVTRDYFIAADAEGALLWIFRERPVHGASAAWYLHGLFG